MTLLSPNPQLYHHELFIVPLYDVSGAEYDRFHTESDSRVHELKIHALPSTYPTLVQDTPCFVTVNFASWPDEFMHMSPVPPAVKCTTTGLSGSTGRLTHAYTFA